MSAYKVKGKVVLLEDNPVYSLDNTEQAKHLKSLLNASADTMAHQSAEIELLRERIKRLESAGEGLWAFLQNQHGFSQETKTLLTIDWIKAKMVKGEDGSR